MIALNERGVYLLCMSYFVSSRLQMAIDPAASMQAVGNPDLLSLAAEVRDRLSAALERAGRPE